MDTALIFSVVPNLLPTFMLGFIAFLGLLVQKKTFSEIITGVVKTMAGVLILFAAVDMISAVIAPISTLFAHVYQFSGTPITLDWTGFLGKFGIEVVFGFFINILLARITPLKYVYLTGHIMFWKAFVIVGTLANSGKVTGIPLIVIGSILQGVITTVFPALVAPFVFKTTGNKDFTIGHSTTIQAVIGGLVGKYFGDASNSAEKIKISEKWDWLKSMVVTTSIIMFLLYFVFGLIAGQQWAATQFAGGSTAIWYLWIIKQGILFGASLTILLTGVRMMLAEIVPAFHGIAKKIVPNAIPALDCPMIFQYGQNSLTIGFPIAVASMLITLVVFGMFGWSQYVLLPLVVAAFFDVGPGCVLANGMGGIRGVIIYAILGGVLLIVLQWLSLPFVSNTAAGFVNAYGGNDVSVIPIVVGGVQRLLGF
jgi:PTS system ascorbate-specific IIC component